MTACCLCTAALGASPAQADGTPVAIAVAPQPFEARYPFGVFVDTMDVSGVSMTLEDTSIEALEGYSLPELTGTRDVIGISGGIDAIHASGASVFLQFAIGGTRSDDGTARAPIGAEGDMLDLDLSSLFFVSTHAGAGYSVPIGDTLSVYGRAYAGVRAIAQTAEVSFMDSEIGSEGASDFAFDAGAQVGARVRLSDHYDLWAGWNERLPRASGFVIGLGYTMP